MITDGGFRYLKPGFVVMRRTPNGVCVRVCVCVCVCANVCVCIRSVLSSPSNVWLPPLS